MNKPLLSLFKLRKSIGATKLFMSGVAIALLLLAISPRAQADSLWQDDTAKPMLADKRANRVGDIVTILVQESNSASKDNSTKTARQSSLDAALSTFLYSPAASGLLTKSGTLPAVKFNSKSDFSGSGSVNNSEKIVARIAVRVVDVLPNGNLIVEGTRESAFSGEQQTIILRGTIRLDDILANNTVFSYNVADATIKFVSRGVVAEAQRKGWFHRFWDFITPF